MNLHSKFPYLLGLLAAYLCLPLGAAPLLPIAEENGVYTLPLETLNDSTQPISLRGTEATRTVSFPVSPRMAIQSARLETLYTSSVSLQARSQLSISLDNRILAQMPIRPDQPDNSARIELNPRSLIPGYHAIGFHAAQHYTYHCEDSSAAELFTQIDVKNSFLRIAATRNPIHASLAELNALFDSRLWLNQFPLHILSADPSLLEASALAAQGAALRLEFMPLHINYAAAEVKPHEEEDSFPLFPGLDAPPEHDIILLGTVDTLKPLLADTLLEKIQGAFLGVYPLDSDPTRGVVLIAGMDAAQVTQAAQVFAQKGYAMPDRNHVLIKELDLPKNFSRLLGVGNTPSNASPDESGWISFSRLGFATTTLHGMYPQPAELQFWAFSEMFPPRQRHLSVEINFAYGTGFDQNSGLNIMLNGQFIQALPLRDPNGTQIWRAKINIPIAQLKAGRNSLSFAPSVIGEDVGGECKPIFTDNLYVSIAEDSRIALPPNRGFMRLPDLSLMSRTGLPYTQASDAATSAVTLLDAHEATLSAALTFIGKLAQVNKAPLSALQLGRADSLSTEITRRNQVLFGTPQNMPLALQNEVVAFLPDMHWQTLTVGNREHIVQANLASWLGNLGQIPWVTQHTQAVNAKLTLASDLGQSNAVVQFQSAYTGGSVTLFSSRTPQQLQRGVNQLVQFSTWGALNGNGMLWSAAGEPIAFSFPSTHSFIGNIPTSTLISLLLSDRPWLLIVLALAVILLLTIVSWVLLRRRAQKIKTGL